MNKGGDIIAIVCAQTLSFSTSWPYFTCTWLYFYSRVPCRVLFYSSQR